MKYREFDDNELLSFIEENNEDMKELLCKKYEPYISHMAAKIFHHSKYNHGLELKDLIQEGMIGLTQAIDTYQATSDASFYTYAKTCIDHKMLSLMQQRGRKKHKVFNESLSLDSLLDDTDNLENIILKDDSVNPEKQLMNQETENEILRRLREELSSAELQIFDLKLSGLNYRDIAEFLEKSPKIVDNTLQRIKVKLKRIIKELESQD